MHRELKLKTIRAKQQALVANECGKKIEALAKTLQKRYQIVANYGCEMEEYALLMQYYYTQHLLMYTLLQEQDLYFTDLPIEA